MWSYALRYLYASQILFVDKYWQKAENISSRNFWIWIKVSPLRVMRDTCFLDCDACEYFEVTWEVAIWLYQNKVGNRKNKVYLKLDLWVSFQRILLFHIWIHLVSYSLLIQVLFCYFSIGAFIVFGAHILKTFVVIFFEVINFLFFRI